MQNILFLCTGNTARSILAEAILAQDGAGRFSAFSAGSQPKGVVNPFAIRVLTRHGYAVSEMRSKSWDEFAAPGAPVMDYIFTVCDNAAGEACPLWLGHPTSAHWGIADPAAVDGTDSDKEAAFETAFALLQARVSAFLALPLEAMNAAQIKAALQEIGAMPGASMGMLE
jgi:arsenate reductase (thioredoxin)